MLSIHFVLRRRQNFCSLFNICPLLFKSKSTWSAFTLVEKTFTSGWSVVIQEHSVTSKCPGSDVKWVRKSQLQWQAKKRDNYLLRRPLMERTTGVLQETGWKLTLLLDRHFSPHHRWALQKAHIQVLQTFRFHVYGCHDNAVSADVNSGELEKESRRIGVGWCWLDKFHR